MHSSSGASTLGEKRSTHPKNRRSRRLSVVVLEQNTNVSQPAQTTVFNPELSDYSQLNAQSRWSAHRLAYLYRAVSMTAMIVHTLVIPASFLLVLLLFSVPLLWPLLFLYLLIIFLDHRPESGAPLNQLQIWCRNSLWWKAFACYYPIRLHKTVDLAPSAPPVTENTLISNISPFTWPDFPLLWVLWPLIYVLKSLSLIVRWRISSNAILPAPKPESQTNNSKYLFAISPHGIISMGAFGAMATNGANWSELFPGVTVRLLTLASNFYFPFYRQYLLATGVASVSKQSCLNLLHNNQNIAIVVGGAKESLLAEPHQFKLILERRMGFVKVALQTGASLVPVLSFGENDIYEQVRFPPNSWGHKLHLLMSDYLGFTLPLFHARGIFSHTKGLLAYRRPINVVVGRPIMVTQNPDPSQTEIESLHATYIAELRQLFAENVGKYSPGVKLDIVG